MYTTIWHIDQYNYNSLVTGPVRYNKSFVMLRDRVNSIVGMSICVSIIQYSIYNNFSFPARGYKWL